MEQTVLRVIVAYLFIMLALRMVGKREIGELTSIDLVTLLLIPELVQQGIVGEDFSMTNGLIALSTLFSLVLISSIVSYIIPGGEKVIEGEPVVLVRRGEFIEENLDRARVPPGDVFGSMRKAGLERLSQVKWAILESDGRISVIPMKQEEKQIKKEERPPVG